LPLACWLIPLADQAARAARPPPQQAAGWLQPAKQNRSEENQKMMLLSRGDFFFSENSTSNLNKYFEDVDIPRSDFMLFPVRLQSATYVM